MLAGKDGFLKEIMEIVKDKLDISKLEDEYFRFTGRDVKKEKGRIELSLND